VYRARPLPSLPSKQVAVKRLLADASEADLRAEVELLSRCNHSNLVPLLGYSIEGRCLVYPLAPCGSLEDRLFSTPAGQQRLAMLDCHAPPPLLWQHRVRILRDVLRALVYLHKEAKPAVFHGDVKPPNILLDAHGNALLADVGLAKVAEGLQSQQTHCSIVSPRGTPGYIDPLIINGLQHSEVTDGYAIGVTILVTLTARPAVGLHEVCRCLLRSPERPDRWETPGIPDISGGEWPPEVTAKLVEVVRGTSLEPFKDDRMPLTEAKAALETIVEAAGFETAVVEEPSEMESVAQELRTCTICLDNEREVRFECGHCVTYAPAARTIDSQDY
jgi:serine/threonine protein kinase